MKKDLPKWYEKLIADCKKILDKGKGHQREFIRSKHELGCRILQDVEHFKGWKQKGTGEFIKQLARDLGCSESTVGDARRFAVKFPDFELFLIDYEQLLGEDFYWTFIRNNLVCDKTLPKIVTGYVKNRVLEKSIQTEILNVAFLYKIRHLEEIKLLVKEVELNPDENIKILALQVKEKIRAPPIRGALCMKYYHVYKEEVEDQTLPDTISSIGEYVHMCTAQYFGVCEYVMELLKRIKELSKRCE